MKNWEVTAILFTLTVLHFFISTLDNTNNGILRKTTDRAFIGTCHKTTITSFFLALLMVSLL